jgi:hypothetical protein
MNRVNPECNYKIGSLTEKIKNRQRSLQMLRPNHTCQKGPKKSHDTIPLILEISAIIPFLEADYTVIHKYGG